MAQVSNEHSETHIPRELLSPALLRRLRKFVDSRLPGELHLTAVRSGLEREDLVQEICLRFLKDRCCSLRVATAVLNSLQRRAESDCGYTLELYDEFTPCWSADPEQQLQAREALEQVLTLVMQLSHRVRKIWVMRYLQDLNQAEIAEQLGLDETTVRRFLTHVRVYLDKRRDKVE